MNLKYLIIFQEFIDIKKSLWIYYILRNFMNCRIVLKMTRVYESYDKEK